MWLIAWCAKKFRYYVVFSRSITFILGLIFSFKLVEKVLFNIFITRLTEDWESPNLPKAAIIVNLQEGTSASVQLVFAVVADAWTGSFKMLVGSTALYITGLFLTHLARDKEDYLVLNIFYPALVLMTLAQAAKGVTLQWFLLDQLREKPSTREKEERGESRSHFWWYSVAFSAAIFALFGPLKDVSFWTLAMVLAIGKSAALVVFLLGVKFYKYVGATGSPLSDVARVMYRAAFAKRNATNPEQPPVKILPRVSWLRWLDRAVDDTCRPERVKVAKFFLKMIPLWTTFIAFSLISASGSTFFLEEASTLTDETFPILLLTNMQRFIEFIVAETSNHFLEKITRRKPNIKQRVMLARIGAGMVCCVLCCVAAWENAVRRLRLVRSYGDPMGHMSVYRLTPQYLLLAFMGGLALDGLGDFFASQVPVSMLRYAPVFGECVVGVGKFLSVFCVIIFREWIKKETNGSRLDKYYAMLAIVSSVNVVYYCLVACWYGNGFFHDRDGDVKELGVADLQEQVLEDVQLALEGTDQEIVTAT